MNSGKKMSNNKAKLRGFMCRASASTAVSCMPNDMRSVTAPSHRSSRRSVAVYQHDIIGSNVKYTKLVGTENIHCKVLKKDTYLPPTERCKRTDLRRPLNHHFQTGVRESRTERKPYPCNQKKVAISKRLFSVDFDAALKSRHLPQQKLSLETASQINSECSSDVFQVVVLRVSLHCQGCAGKVKKHLSRMEGVTSFNIDLEAKRVTVMGHVSPTEVVESVSRIKRAELWTC